MKTCLTTVFSSVLLASVLFVPVAQAQEAAPQGLPLFNWLSSLVPSTAAGNSGPSVQVAPLKPIGADQTVTAAAGAQAQPQTGFLPASAVTPVELPASSANGSQTIAVAPPVAATPDSSIVVAAAPRSTALRRGSAKTRVYTFDDIFGTGQSTAVTAPVSAGPNTAVRVATNTPQQAIAPAATVRTKKKVNMKTWKSGSKRAKKVEKKTTNGLDPNFVRTQVKYETEYEVGTIIIDPNSKYLYLVEADGMALRYGVGVGRAGFEWSGTAKIKRKVEWPTWTPPAAMRKREPWLPARMEGGIDNPLGARALYLYQGNRDTMYRIHGTNNPSTIGKAVSAGCIRLINDDVADLFNRVPMGTTVVVLESQST